MSSATERRRAWHGPVLVRAVPNWTGRLPIVAWPLVWCFLPQVMGRILISIPSACVRFLSPAARVMRKSTARP